MMTLDHVGNQEAMVHAQLGQQPLAHIRLRRHCPATETRDALLFERAAFCSRHRDGRTAQGGVCVAEHCPVSILQAHGGDATPRFALWTIERFVAPAPSAYYCSLTGGDETEREELEDS